MGAVALLGINSSQFQSNIIFWTCYKTLMVSHEILLKSDFYVTYSDTTTSVHAGKLTKERVEFSKGV